MIGTKSPTCNHGVDALICGRKVIESIHCCIDFLNALREAPASTYSRCCLVGLAIELSNLWKRRSILRMIRR